jgi:hypothetical protein
MAVIHSTFLMSHTVVLPRRQNPMRACELHHQDSMSRLFGAANPPSINTTVLQAVDEGFPKEYFVHMPAARFRRSEA